LAKPKRSDAPFLDEDSSRRFFVRRVDEYREKGAIIEPIAARQFKIAMRFVIISPRLAAPQKILDAGAMHRSTKSAILTGE
jgi:hypothetical protein